MKRLLLSLLFACIAGQCFADINENEVKQLESLAGRLAQQTIMGATNVIIAADKSFSVDSGTGWDKIVKDLDEFITTNSPKNLSAQNKKLFKDTVKLVKDTNTQLYQHVYLLRQQLKVRKTGNIQATLTPKDLGEAEKMVERINKLKKNININRLNPFWNDYPDTKAIKNMLKGILKSLVVLVDKTSRDAEKTVDLYKKSVAAVNASEQKL